MEVVQRLLADCEWHEMEGTGSAGALDAACAHVWTVDDGRFGEAVGR